jgi:hypothetical protein
MMVAIGVDVDPTFVTFVDRALEVETGLTVVNLRAAVEGDWRFDVPAHASATLHYNGVAVELQPDDAFYCRIMDLSSQAGDLNVTRRWQGLQNGLRAWLDSVPGLVVNRSRGGLHNGSKPLHEAVLRELGFRVPESVTSSDVDELRRFIRDGAAVSKTVCGVRADTALCTETDLQDFESANGPVHLQRFVAGADVRIHVIGERLVAQRAPCGKVDYRAGGFEDMSMFESPAALRDLLVEGTRALGLEFAGWDFKIDGKDQYWCLEANPMPGYSPYDDRCDGAISRELLRHLGEGESLL